FTTALVWLLLAGRTTLTRRLPALSLGSFTDTLPLAFTLTAATVRLPTLTTAIPVGRLPGTAKVATSLARLPALIFFGRASFPAALILPTVTGVEVAVTAS